MKFLITITAAMLAFNAATQTPTSTSDPAGEGRKTEKLAILSSTICDMCEETIESNLIYEKGVKKVEVDLTTSTVHIEFDPRKNDAASLRTALTMLGYSADGMPGDAKAFAKLPACCQKEGCGKLPEKQ